MVSRKMANLFFYKYGLSVRDGLSSQRQGPSKKQNEPNAPRYREECGGL